MEQNELIALHLQEVHGELHRALYTVDSMWEVLKLIIEGRAAPAEAWKNALSNLDQLETELSGGDDLAGRAQYIEAFMFMSHGAAPPAEFLARERAVWDLLQPFAPKKGGM